MRLSEAEFAQRFPDHPLAKAYAGEKPAQKRARKSQIKGAPKPKESVLEALFYQQTRGFGLPEPVRELAFHEERKWRFDFAWPDQKIAVEVEGGIWNQGRHTRSHGFMADSQKYNTALSMGWKVLRFTGPDIRSGEAIKVVQAVLKGEETLHQRTSSPRSRSRRPAANI